MVNNNVLNDESRLATQLLDDVQNPTCIKIRLICLWVGIGTGAGNVVRAVQLPRTPFTRGPYNQSRGISSNKGTMKPSYDVSWSHGTSTGRMKMK
jgi:hypothetical protein